MGSLLVELPFLLLDRGGAHAGDVAAGVVAGGGLGHGAEGEQLALLQHARLGLGSRAPLARYRPGVEDVNN